MKAFIRNTIILIIMAMIFTGFLYAQTEAEWNWKTVSAGGNFSLAIQEDGTLWAWGRKSYDVETRDLYNPVRTVIVNDYGSTPIQMGRDTNWAFISAGSNHALAIKTDGTLWVWGANNNGQLGDGTTTDRTIPVRIGTVWASASAGHEFTVAISRDGSLWSWGLNSTGQLGNGTTSSRNNPGRVGTAANWTTVSAGSRYTVAINRDGVLWAWGRKSYNVRSGNFMPTTQTIVTNQYGITPIRIGTDTNWASISAGSGHTLAIKTDGTLWAWGANNQGQLGDDTRTNRTDPIQIGPATNWVHVSAGGSNTIAVRTNGTLWAWGVSNITPTRIGTDTNWASASAGSDHLMATKTNGTLWAWGGNRNGQIGNGWTSTGSTNDLIHIGIRQNWVFSSAIGNVAIRRDGSLWDIYRRQMIGTDRNWATVSARSTNVRNNNHFAAIKADGSLWVWGSFVDEWVLNIGLGNSGDIPRQIGTDRNWAIISTGNNYYAGIKTDGTLWVLTINPTAPITPTQMGRDRNWAFVSAGSEHTMAIKTDGTLWAWGNNENGRLGATWGECCCDMKESAVPIQVGTDTNWTSVSAGGRHTLAIKTDGTLWAWGFNESGQLGDGTTISRLTPVRIGTDNTWVSVSAGNTHTAAIRRDGSTWIWGGRSNLIPTRFLVPAERWGGNFSALSVSCDDGNNILIIGKDGSLWNLNLQIIP
ncbi:MAG: hypothetical protein FWD14_08515 [Treponema sp.]|nr:hypothetical protein [Treponema sp.]